MVLDKNFDLVVTKSTQADRSHFTAMEISVKKVPAKQTETYKYILQQWFWILHQVLAM